MCLKVVWNLECEVFVNTNVRRVASLCDSTVRVFSTVGVDLVRAVVFLVVLALVASKICANLGTRTSTVTDLDLGDLGPDLDNTTNNLVPYAERKRDVLSPSTGDSMDIRSADTASINGNIDIVILELLERKLFCLSAIVPCLVISHNVLPGA